MKWLVEASGRTRAADQTDFHPLSQRGNAAVMAFWANMIQMANKIDFQYSAAGLSLLCGSSVHHIGHTPKVIWLFLELKRVVVYQPPLKSQMSECPWMHQQDRTVQRSLTAVTAPDDERLWEEQSSWSPQKWTWIWSESSGSAVRKPSKTLSVVRCQWTCRLRVQFQLLASQLINASNVLFCVLERK